MLRTPHRRGLSRLFVFSCALPAALCAQDSKPTWPHAEQLHARIEIERQRGAVPGIAIAIVEHGKLVHADGWGFADAKGTRPMRPDSRVRAGSISKLFTDLAILQLVEKGKLDLDKDVRAYLPDFAPRTPSGVAITLRHLITHHSGLLREPPLGSYFDSGGTTLKETVASLSSTELVHAPGTRFQYSNAGVSVVGRVLEAVLEQPFAECIETAICKPLKLADTGFVPKPDLLAHALMWTYDGRRFPAPTFALGIAPAGSLETTVKDLARFGSELCFDRDGRIVSPATLRAMFTPQLTHAGKAHGVGLGFFVSHLGADLQVGHSGAVYGYATDLAIFPERGLVIAAVATLDCANGVAAKVVRIAHALMSKAEVTDPTADPTAAQIDRHRGTWKSDDAHLEIMVRSGRVLLHPEQGLCRKLRSQDDGALIVDDVFGTGPALTFHADKLVWQGREWTRVPVAKPAPCPAAWRELVGEYGWDHDVLYVLERDGKLQMLVEWFEYATLRPTRTPDHFQLDATGLYANETVTVVRDAANHVTGLLLGATAFPRRRIAPDEGVTFQITPLRPIAELRAAALAAKPPAQPADLRKPDLVELVSLDPTIRLDLRYATTNNFLGTKLYERARAMLQRPAAEAVVRAHHQLRAQGFGLLIHDAYRPWSVTKMFWDATPEHLRNFVADPSRGSRHNRGCAVDLTLYDLADGKPIEMVSGFDEFTPRAWPDYPGGTALQRWHRKVLREALESEGFTVYEEEWWHFDYKDWKAYPVLDERL